MTKEQLTTALSEIAKEPYEVLLDNGDRLQVLTVDHILFAPDGTVIIYPNGGGRHTMLPIHITAVKETPVT